MVITCGLNSRISRTSAPAASSTSWSGEAALRQRRQRVALGQAGVDEAEPRLLHAEDLAGLVHLLLAHLVDVLLDVRVALELGVEDGAALASRAGGDQHVHPLGHVLGHGGRALARLVVGVRVHGHQSQLVSQDSILVNSSRRAPPIVTESAPRCIPDSHAPDQTEVDRPWLTCERKPTESAPRVPPACRRAGTGVRAAAERDARTDRRLKIVGAVLGVLGLAGIGWLGVSYISGQEVSGEMIKFKVVSDRAVEVHLEVRKDAGARRRVHAARAGGRRRRGGPQGRPLRRVPRSAWTRSSPYVRRRARPAPSWSAANRGATEGH